MTQIRPALNALLARLCEAQEACGTARASVDTAQPGAADRLAKLHSDQISRLRHILGASALKAMLSCGSVAEASAADMLVGGALPARLAVMEDRLMRAFDRAILLEHAEPASTELVRMKADLVALHDKIGLQ